MFIVRRQFSSSSCRFKKVVPTKLKGKSTSSQQWLTRQLTDPYVEKAKMLNYRCRSAFKLIEIDDKYKFLHPGQVVVDCGASPGSWSQVAVKRVNADGSMVNKPVGKVMSIDKQQIYPLQGAVILGNMDFTLMESQKKILNAIDDDDRVDVVLSDMAPSATGIKELDKENMINLCYTCLRFALQISKVSGVLLMKLWQCGQTKQLEDDLIRYYNNVKIVKPLASRTDSAEIFLLARDFKGLKSG